MKRVLWVVGVGLVLLAGLGLGLGLGWQRGRQRAETGPGGRSVESWRERLRSDDPREGRQAAEELAGLGEPGLAVLLEARKDSDIRAHRRAAAALTHLGADAAGPLVEALPRGGQRVEVILVRMGPVAIESLERGLRNKETALPAAQVLGAMGPRARPAIGALVALLQDLRASDDARAAAAWALGQIGPQTSDGPPGQLAGDPAIGALTAALSGPPVVRRAAALALGESGQAAHPAIPSLARLSRDEDVTIALAACDALGQMRSRAGAAALLARLQQADAASPAAASALARLGPEARAAVSGLIDSLRSKKADARLARAVLERLGAVAVPDLVDALKAPGEARKPAAEVLGLMGPRAIAAAPALEALLSDRDPAVVLAAVAALVRIDPGRSKVVVAAIVPLVLRPEAEIATAATAILAGLGPDAALAAGVLVTALQAKDGRVVARAAFVLGRLRRPPTRVVAALAEALSGPQKSRPACAQALGHLGAEAKSAVPALVAALSAAKNDPAVRAQVALALVRIDPPRAARALEVLTPDLEGESGPAQLLALEALARMRPVPPEALPAVRALLGDRQTALAALAVLAAMERKYLATVTPDLLTLLSSSDPRLREGAVEVLVRIGPPTLRGLETTMKSGSPLARAAAARAWREVAPEDPLENRRSSESTALVALLDDPEPAVRQAAAETIAAVGTEQDATQQAMLALLARPEAELRRPAARLPRALKRHPAEWTPYLLECLFDPDAEVRRQAALSLPAEEAEVRRALRGLLGDPAPSVRLAAARRLGRDREAIAVVADLARRAAPGERAELLRLLHRIDRGRARALLGELEADPRADDLDARLESAVALIEMDESRAVVVLPLLSGILEGWDERARVRAARALAALGKRARPALAALRRRVERDESESVRRAAEAAIRAITAKKGDG
jgi:HEAT repeat protein